MSAKATSRYVPPAEQVHGFLRRAVGACLLSVSLSFVAAGQEPAGASGDESAKDFSKGRDLEDNDLEDNEPADTDPDDQEQESDEDDSEDLRERLTEREDENRVENPWSIELRGRPLVISGEYEAALDYFDETVLGVPDEHFDRLLLEQELETEMFYSLGRRLSVYAQARIVDAHDLHDNTPNQINDTYVERGEMWLYSEDVAGSGLSVEVGRLDFEDDRLWWWDEDLDALRVTYEQDEFELAVAVAQELAPRRSDLGFIDPEDHKVLRYFGEASWDWASNHALQLFGLVSSDHSYNEIIDQTVPRDRADESDAEMTWIGLRASGAWQSDTRGLLGYWLDYAQVRGDERLAEFGEESTSISVVKEVIQRRVRGWAYDTGVTWIAPLRGEPRISMGYAVGSDDRNSEDSIDRSFHQTGLHGNEVGFGGVERFDHYGVLLDPELSNLSVWTVGIGISLFNASSLDLVYNRYRLGTPADSLRDARIDIELTGEHRDLGDAFDLVLAVEEWQRVEFEMIASALNPGPAFASDAGHWQWGGLLVMRVAF